MKNTAWVYLSTSASNLFILLAGAVSGMLSARLLGPAGRGELAVIQYYPALMGTFCCLAIPQGISFFISREPDRTSEFAAAGVRIALLLGIIGSLGFALIAPLTLGEGNRHLSWPVMVACLAAPTMVLTPFMSATYQGMHRFNWVNGMQIFVAGGYAFFILGFWGTNLASPLNFYFAQIILQIIANSIYAWRLGLALLRSRVAWKTYLSCVTQGLQFFMPVLAGSLIYMSSGAILIRNTTLTEIGYYSIALALTAPLGMAAGAFVQIGFVEMAGTQDGLATATLLTRRFHMAQVVVILSALVLLPLAYPVMRYGFGPKFLPALPAMYIMVAAVSLGSLNAVLENSFRAKNLVWPGVISSLLAVAGLIILGSLWVPKWGAVGIALALLCAAGIGATILIYLAGRVLSIQLRDLWGLRPTILAGFAHSFWQFLFVKEAHH